MRIFRSLGKPLSSRDRPSSIHMVTATLPNSNYSGTISESTEHQHQPEHCIYEVTTFDPQSCRNNAY